MSVAWARASRHREAEFTNIGDGRTVVKPMGTSFIASAMSLSTLASLNPLIWHNNFFVEYATWDVEHAECQTRHHTTRVWSFNMRPVQLPRAHNTYALNSMEPIFLQTLDNRGVHAAGLQLLDQVVLAAVVLLYSPPKYTTAGAVAHEPYQSNCRGNAIRYGGREARTSSSSTCACSFASSCAAISTTPRWHC